MPKPTNLTTGSAPCVTGPGRPVLRTSGPSFTVTFTSDRNIEAAWEYQGLDGSENTFSDNGEPVVSGRPATLENGPDTFGPGESYRWRARGTPMDAVDEGWSDWCEFTVAADLPDLRDVDNIDGLLELGLYPDRNYTVRLTARQWRLVLEALAGPGEGEGTVVDTFPDGAEAETHARFQKLATAVRKQTGRKAVTLSGDQWATLTNELAGWAVVLDQVAEEEDPGTPDGSATWKVLDLISQRLGGPAHLDAGFYR